MGEANSSHKSGQEVIDTAGQDKTGLRRKACKVQIKNIEMLRICIEVNLCKQIVHLYKER